MNIESRIAKLLDKTAEKGAAAVLISQPDNLYYLSGIEGLEGYLLVTEKKTLIVTDFRYIEQAGRSTADLKGFEIFAISGKMASWLPALFEGLDIRKLGYESSHLTVAAYNQITEILKNSHPGIELTPLEGLVEGLRMVKEHEEIASIRRAAAITDDLFNHIYQVIHPGMSEKAAAWEIEKFMRDRGSQTVPFELIVAAGPNSALPHARPSERPIQQDEPVVIDIGSKFSNYGSDLTRTLCLGKADETFNKVYSVVLKAQLAAISGIEAGMTGAQADAIARRIIDEAGYQGKFGHSLGHGIGLVTHENPRVGPNSPDILTDNMVFTVEPGIYISGWGGVRIEDDVVFENGKLKVISSAPK